MRGIVVWISPKAAVVPMSRVMRPTTVAQVPPSGLVVVSMLVTSSRPAGPMRPSSWASSWLATCCRSSTTPSRPTIRRINGARASAVVYAREAASRR